MNSPGSGVFKATETASQITFRLTYSSLSAPQTFAHIHVAQRGVGGSVTAFLCGGGKPACPSSGTVTGTITAADVLAVPS